MDHPRSHGLEWADKGPKALLIIQKVNREYFSLHY